MTLQRRHTCAVSPGGTSRSNSFPLGGRKQLSLFFFFNDPPPPELYPLPLPAALPTSARGPFIVVDAFAVPAVTISRLQETDPAVSFSPGWIQDNPVVTLIPGVTTGFTQGISLRTWSAGAARLSTTPRSEEHTSELQSPCNLVCRLLLENRKLMSTLH